MGSKGLVAKATTDIEATVEKVWQALITPATIKEYMFGTDVRSDWKPGSQITWEGEWQGKPYQDKGEILKIVPPQMIQYSHFSPLSGLPDLPENYHTVTVELAKKKDSTRVSLSQDNNSNEEERDHSAANWQSMLAALKELLES